LPLSRQKQTQATTKQTYPKQPKQIKRQSRTKEHPTVSCLKKHALGLIQSAIIAAIYAATSIFIGPLGYSWVQLRIGEALTPLPFVLGAPAVMGLTIGCLITNLMSPVGLPDVVIGSMLTLSAAILSWKLSFNEPLLACLYPVLINAIGVSSYLSIFFGVPYFITVLTVGLGESIAVLCIGYPTVIGLRKWFVSKKLERKLAITQNNP